MHAHIVCHGSGVIVHRRSRPGSRNPQGTFEIETLVPIGYIQVSRTGASETGVYSLVGVDPGVLGFGHDHILVFDNVGRHTGMGIVVLSESGYAGPNIGDGLKTLTHASPSCGHAINPQRPVSDLATSLKKEQIYHYAYVEAVGELFLCGQFGGRQGGRSLQAGVN